MMLLNRDLNDIDQTNYDNIYNKRLEAEDKWLKAAAVQRVDNIYYFLKRFNLKPNRIMDLGCGTGAVTGELKKRGIGKEYSAVDYSGEAVDLLKKTLTDVNAYVADLTAESADIKGDFDLVIAIHVLQHLLNPDQFLQNIQKNFSYQHVIIEVPLEDLFMNKLVSKIGLNDKNPTGTLQFFNKKTITEMITRNGFKIIATKNSIPKISLKTLNILKQRYSWSGIQFAKKFFTSFIFPKIFGPVKKRLHYSYYSILCVKN